MSVPKRSERHSNLQHPDNRPNEFGQLRSDQSAERTLLEQALEAGHVRSRRATHHMDAHAARTREMSEIIT